MTAITLALEVDAQAHPELYAALAGIKNPAYVAERLRQLAALGLVVERLRIAAPSPGTAEELSPSPQLSVVSAPRPELQNFPVLLEEVPESLLVSAVPEPVPSMPAHEPAVLQDMYVDPPIDLEMGPQTRRSPEPGPVPAEPMADTAPIVRMAGNRSRLMRMKNRGLFKNE